MSGGYDRGLYALLGRPAPDQAGSHLIAAALVSPRDRGELVAAGVATDPTPAAPLDVATELACAAMLYLIRKPGFETARRRLRAAANALPPPPLGSLPGGLLYLRLAAETALRGSRSEAGMRISDASLRRSLEGYCLEVRRSLDAELGVLLASATMLTGWPTDEVAEALENMPAELAEAVLP